MKPLYTTPLKTPKRKKVDAEREFDSVKVYCRLKPLKLRQKSCIEVTSNTTLQLSLPDYNKSQKEFVFEKIFTENSTQQHIFDEVALPLVERLVNGENGLIFTYGVTGGGKTYTMTGVKDDIGIMPRCLNVLFNSIPGGPLAAPLIFKPDTMNSFYVQTMAEAEHERAERDRLKIGKNKKIALTKNNSIEDLSSASHNDGTTVKVKDIDDSMYAVFVTYVEVYNNVVYDLLENTSESKNFPKAESKIIREDASRKSYVSGATEVEIQNTEEAVEVFYYGNKRKRMACTTLNADSSRGHSVFTIRVVQAPLDEKGEEVDMDKTKICVSQLSFVDLAGTERANRTNNIGNRLTEACKINSSLMKLRNCLETLCNNQKLDASKIVPYRDQKITYLLKHFFDGDGSIRMIACVNPCMEDANENAFALKFSEMSQGISVQCTPKKFNTFCTPAKRNPVKRLPILEENDVNDSKPFPLREQFTSVAGFYDATINLIKDNLEKRNTIVGNLRMKEAKFKEMLKKVGDELDGYTYNQESNEPSAAEIKIKELQKQLKILLKKYTFLEMKYEELRLGILRDAQIPETGKRKAPHDDITNSLKRQNVNEAIVESAQHLDSEVKHNADEK